MAKMTMPVIETLYSYGRKVYDNELNLSTATEEVLKLHGDAISESSASFYINLFSEYMSGKGSTWNQNSSLVLYYVEHITNERGSEAGENAYKAAMHFAVTKGKNALKKDLEQLWSRYESIGGNEDDAIWQPPLKEYDPQISKEKWLELLHRIVGPVWGGVLAMFYTEKEGSTCSEIAKKFNMKPMEVSGRCTQLAKRVYKETNCPLFNDDEKERYWLILFLWKEALTEEKGNYVWKLRPELYDALTEFDILRFLPRKGVDAIKIDFKLSPKYTVEHIKNYISSKGFTYPDSIIENLYLSLKSKPFVILAGTSGTGKTKLVELFADAIGAEYSLVSVRPDWSDGSDLFGHHDLNGNFIEGPVCEAFDKAIADPDRPVLLCLDEMNLARVEYYLSDFLSVIESRKKGDDGTIRTKPIAQYADGIPDNLYFVGTVNMDETTFPFSKKVLDRANTIEFNYVELLPDFDTADSEQEALDIPNSFLKTEYLVLALDCADEKEFVTEVCGELQKINVILREANAHVGYRVRDEIVFYMLNNKKAGKLLTEDEAMDNEIMQKILPRIQGSSVAIRDMLVKLFKFCMGNQSGPDTDSGKAGKQMQGMADSA